MCLRSLSAWGSAGTKVQGHERKTLGMTQEPSSPLPRLQPVNASEQPNHPFSRGRPWRLREFK